MKKMKTAFCNIFTAFIFLFASLSFAANNLDVSVDRTEIGLNETLNLRINANIKMDFSFGGLMNFGRNQVEAPDTTELEKYFDIIDRQQNYSMRSINGETSSQVVWSLALAPKQSGELTIPSLKLKDAESKPIKIKVLENNAQPSVENPPPAFLEVITDKQDAYVQEQIILTVRLYTQGRMSNASLTEPESTKAIIESFGEDKKSYRMAYNQRYDVIERQYLVFPQESGLLTIPALNFNGMLIDSYSRRRLRVREQSNELNIEIKAPNPSFTGENWLPAISLHIEENWQEPNKQLKVGDSITREVKLTTLGLLGSAIPPFKHTDHESFKSYPDKPIVESLQHINGSQASRTESTTYIAIKPGTLEIPEQVISWWDTTNNVERHATLPARQLTVTGTTSQVPQTPPLQNTASIKDSQSKDSESTTIEKELQSNESNNSVTSNNANNLGLFVLLLLTLAAWATTSYLLIRRLKEKEKLAQALIRQQNLSAPIQQTVSSKDLIKAINEETAELPKLYVEWLKSFAKYKHINSIADIKHLNIKIYKELNSFEQSIYSKSGTDSTTFSKEALIQETNKLTDQLKRKEPNSGLTTLQAFYPR